MKSNLQKVNILGVEVTSASKNKILEHVDELLGNTGYQGYIVTPNPEMIVYARSDTTFRQILNHAQVSLVDGMGLYLALKLLKKGVVERVSGIDFVLDLCSKYAEKPVKLGFLGGRGTIAERAVECLLKTHPRLTVSFVSDEWTRQGFANARLLMKKQREKLEQDSPARESAENESIDILFVAYGFPKQEYFMAENLPNMPVKIGMGVGGAFDYISGNVMRAPRAIQLVGLEWLFRLIRQPWRWRRQLALLTFGRLVMRELLRNNKNN